MWLMKVIYNLKNSMIQEFQHSLESRLIQVMNGKMSTIQFVSNVNLIQMWLMKVIYKMKNILIQEFPYSLELKLIEDMIQKIQPIQFVSSVNLIQTQSTYRCPMFCRNVKLASWLMPVQNNNRVRNPDTQNLCITAWTTYNGMDSAISHNSSTFIQFSWVWIINSSPRSERKRLQYESEASPNRSESTS
jgi:hypothetical protein